MICSRSQSDLDQNGFFILETSSGESESIANPTKRQERSVFLRGGSGSSHWPRAPGSATGLLTLCLLYLTASSGLSLHFLSLPSQPTDAILPSTIYFSVSLCPFLSLILHKLLVRTYCVHITRLGPECGIIRPSECWVVFPTEASRSAEIWLYNKEIQ